MIRKDIPYDINGYPFIVPSWGTLNIPDLWESDEMRSKAITGVILAVILCLLVVQGLVRATTWKTVFADVDWDKSIESIRYKTESELHKKIIPLINFISTPTISYNNARRI